MLESASSWLTWIIELHVLLFDVVIIILFIRLSLTLNIAVTLNHVCYTLLFVLQSTITNDIYILLDNCLHTIVVWCCSTSRVTIILIDCNIVLFITATLSYSRFIVMFTELQGSTTHSYNINCWCRDIAVTDWLKH